MQGIHLKYVNESYDEKGILSEFSLNVPEDFNFSYDVIDEMARLQPNKRTLEWCNVAGEKHTFTFGDMKKYSDKTANLLQKAGVKKGDMVMLILKLHFEFWFSIIALHKLGAVAIPATSLLTVKDLLYRLNAAHVTAIVCTADGVISDYIDDAQKQYPYLTTKIIVRGEKAGWACFSDELKKADEHFERPQGEMRHNLKDPMLLYFTSGTTGMPKMVCHDYSYPLGHITTAKHWHNVDPDGLHLTVSETGWAKSVWGKLYGVSQS